MSRICLCLVTGFCDCFGMLRTSRITLLDLLAMALAIAIVILLVAPQDTAVRDQDLPAPAVRLETTGTVPSDGAASAAFAEWARTTAHHGAFAIGRDGGFGWTSDYNTLEMAEASALAFCGADCKVVAYAAPVDPSPFGLGASAAVDYANYAFRLGHKAFAISDSGATGWSWSYGTALEARARAMTECNARLANRQTHLPQAPCRIIEAGS